MAKRKKGGGANWQDTYGDMVTLLLCFFVLLYSMSTLDQQKWEILIRSLNPDAITSVDANVGNDGPSADPPSGTSDDPPMEQQEIDDNIEELYQQLKAYVEAHENAANISVTKGEGHVFVAFNDAIFFDGDSSYLRKESQPVLDFVAGAVSEASEAIDELRIIGNTARVAIDEPNDVYKDRMLAVQRASEVLIYLQLNPVMTLDPGRMVAVGFGEWRPVGDNATAEGRAENRRVEMIVTGKNLEQELDSVGTYYAQRGGATLTGGASAPPVDEGDAPLVNDSPLPSAMGTQSGEEGT